MALTTVSSDRLSTNVKNTNFTAAEKQDLTDDILPLAGQLGNRNLIINGAMNVAQRGTSSTTSGIHTVDRIGCDFGGADENPTQEQVDVAAGTTPYSLGFRKAFKITNGNQTSGAGASDYVRTDYKIEAQDVAGSGWNYTSSSSNITLSFWVKSSVSKDFNFLIHTTDGTAKLYPMTTGTLSADTWTKITKTIPGVSTLTFDNNNGSGIIFQIYQYLGTTYTANSVTNNQWQNYSSTEQTPDQTSTWWTTNDATFEITGVQLEVGSVATDFEHRSFGQELFLCRRYAVVWKSKNENKDYIMPAKVEDADDANWAYETSPQMRSTPTIEISSTSHISIEYRNGNMVNPVNFSTRTYNDQYENRLFINMDINQNVFSEGDIVYLAFANYTANGTGQFILNAEL